jgi:hypothetical protein
MRRFDTSRMQVMVMDPILIPQHVNVVIGESLYELIFREEGASFDSNSQPMDTDKFQDDGGSGSKEAQNLKLDKQPSAQGSN